jgi:hypothetical protein
MEAIESLQPHAAAKVRRAMRTAKSSYAQEPKRHGFRIPDSEFANSYHAFLSECSRRVLSVGGSRLFDPESGLRNSRI